MKVDRMDDGEMVMTRHRWAIRMADDEFKEILASLRVVTTSTNMGDIIKASSNLVTMSQMMLMANFGEEVRRRK